MTATVGEGDTSVGAGAAARDSMGTNLSLLSAVMAGDAFTGFCGLGPAGFGMNFGDSNAEPPAGGEATTSPLNAGVLTSEAEDSREGGNALDPAREAGTLAVVSGTSSLTARTLGSDGDVGVLASDSSLLLAAEAALRSIDVRVFVMNATASRATEMRFADSTTEGEYSPS